MVDALKINNNTNTYKFQIKNIFRNELSTKIKKLNE
jgi:hypothetical protein